MQKSKLRHKMHIKTRKKLKIAR